MTNDTLVSKLTSLCERYIINSKYEFDFEKRTKNEFIIVIHFLDYYFEEDDENLIIKRNFNSKRNIIKLNKEKILKKYDNRRSIKIERTEN